MFESKRLIENNLKLKKIKNYPVKVIGDIKP